MAGRRADFMFERTTTLMISSQVTTSTTSLSVVCYPYGIPESSGESTFIESMILDAPRHEREAQLPPESSRGFRRRRPIMCDRHPLRTHRTRQERTRSSRQRQHGNKTIHPTPPLLSSSHHRSRAPVTSPPFPFSTPTTPPPTSPNHAASTASTVALPFTTFTPAPTENG